MSIRTPVSTRAPRTPQHSASKQQHPLIPSDHLFPRSASPPSSQTLNSPIFASPSNISFVSRIKTMVNGTIATVNRGDKKKSPVFASRGTNAACALPQNPSDKAVASAMESEILPSTWWCAEYEGVRSGQAVFFERVCDCGN